MITRKVAGGSFHIISPRDLFPEVACNAQRAIDGIERNEVMLAVVVPSDLAPTWLAKCFENIEMDGDSNVHAWGRGDIYVDPTGAVNIFSILPGEKKPVIFHMGGFEHLVIGDVDLTEPALSAFKIAMRDFRPVHRQERI